MEVNPDMVMKIKSTFTLVDTIYEKSANKDIILFRNLLVRVRLCMITFILSCVIDGLEMNDQHLLDALCIPL